MKLKKTIDINCDMGESFGVYKLGNDDEVIKLISSANIACGFHGGDPNVMDHTVKIAKEHGVGIGAHPGFPDLLGFGRRNIDISREDLINIIIYQIGALEMFCKKYNVIMQHVKPHGSMNNMADYDANIAESIVDAILSINPHLPIYVKPNSQLYRIAKQKGLPFVLEFFADRAYNNDLSLVSRKNKDAIISNPAEVAQRVLKMATEGMVETITGDEIEINVESVCVHGDTSTSLKIIQEVRNELIKKGVSISFWHKEGK